MAWLLTGVLLYVPANALPVLRTTGLVGGQASTIIDGIVAFWQSRSYGIAAIIFVASIAVPLTKFAALGLLVFTVNRKSKWASAQRAKLFRAVELIGYWSMLDVIVVGITAAVVQFHVLGTAEPQPGIAFFCAMVVATMLAANTFDARLIWVDDEPVGR